MLIELIEWIDSETECSHPWQDKRDFIKQMRGFSFDPIRSVGIVVYEDTDAITLTISDCGTQIGPHTTIPKVAIISRRALVLPGPIAERTGEDDDEVLPNTPDADHHTPPPSGDW